MLSRTLLVSALAVLAGSGVMAQDLSQLPACAQTCAIGGISSSGCALTDFKCICSASAFLTAMGECTAKACTEDDIKKTLAFATELCASVGVTLPTAPATTSVPATTAAPEATTTTTIKYPITNSTTSIPTGTLAPSIPFEGAASGMQVGSWLGGLVAAAGLVFAL